MVDDFGNGGSRFTTTGELSNYGTIDVGNSGITTAATLNAAGLSNGNFANVNITGGVSGAQAALNLTASPEASTLTGHYTLQGNARLNSTGTTGIATIASGASLALDSPDAQVNVSGLVGNSALQTLATNDGSFTLADGATVHMGGNNLTNNSDIYLDAGFNSFNDLGGSALYGVGTLINDGSLIIGNPYILNPVTVAAARLDNDSGRIQITGGAAQSSLLVTTAPAPATLTGTDILTGDALLRYDSGAITAIGATGELALNGAQARVATYAAPNSNSALTTLASNAGFLELFDGASITTSANFINSGSLGIDDSLDSVVGSGGVGGSSLNVASLTNSGTISITGLALASTLTTGALTNSGTINLRGVAAQGQLLVNAAAPNTLTGTFNLHGPSLLQYASGAISAIGSGASLTLHGGKAQVDIKGVTGNNSALTSLASSSGTLNLENGASLTLSGDYSQSGNLDVDIGYGHGGSSLTVGNLTNNSPGYVQIGNSGLSVATTVTASQLNNNSGGNVYVQGNATGPSATLSLGGASADAGSMSIDVGGVLALGGTLTVSNYLSFGGTIRGGTLAGTGTIISGGGGTLDGVTIAVGTTVTNALGTLTVSGVTNNGAISGSSGATLNFAQNGTDSMTGISGFQTINLADGGANSLTLANGNFTNVPSSSPLGTSGTYIYVNDGNSGNTVDASAVSTTSNAIDVHAGTAADTLTGGAGNDIFYAGGNTTMTGGAGQNDFVFSAPGLNTIADFAASTTNDILFSDSGFALGISGASTTPTALPTTLFNGDGSGTFTNTTQRFSYNSTTGELFFSADGNGGGAAPLDVATLTNHPALTAAHLFYIA